MLRQEKRLCRLTSVTFMRDAPAPPAWLPFSPSDWSQHGHEWYAQVDRMLNVTLYFDIYFQAQTKTRNADAHVAHMRNAEPADADAIRLAKRRQQRVHKWARNTLAALHADAVRTPHASGQSWLLFFEVVLVSPTDEARSDATISCPLCSKFLAALRAIDSQGRLALRGPVHARCRGLWGGGPDPEELSLLSYVERRIIRLARAHVSVKKVWGLRYCTNNDDAAPSYHTRNVVACPNSVGGALTSVGLWPSQLCQDLLVQFQSGRKQELLSDPDLFVCAKRLRSAFHWTGENCWPWMLATKDHWFWGHDNLGTSLESLLSAYAAGLPSSGEPSIPQQLVRTSMPIAPDHQSSLSKGPWTPLRLQLRTGLWNLRTTQRLWSAAPRS